MASEAELRQMVEKFEVRAAELGRSLQQAGRPEQAAAGPGAAVRVTVAPNGMVQDLQLTPLAMQRGREALQQEILAAIKSAQSRARPQPVAPQRNQPPARPAPRRRPVDEEEDFELRESFLRKPKR
ncbi:YbaB/EbfC DNA-binding family protein [Herbihabitans rhizosphaerae]|uniref:YbaB/EbfC DNA-binding family protein n=1 Tax=Herbihabitans rhizosphaerae TaxID=1872711 RepID=A0A4Q7KR63_9PSEU|nr:YbaB/EbfC family nucleoid-associated protein [Herbihabitans rhizosphaerae]RZS39339.1 YbaB/EbfC DNA-binding family protein [Herbihabitans rhizosphaerae]